MIALFDFLPTYCPHCGERLPFDDALARIDFDYSNSHSCDCGLAFQKATTKTLRDAAKASGGDLNRYH